LAERAGDHFVNIDIIWLGHGVQDGSGDRIWSQRSFAELLQKTFEISAAFATRAVPWRPM
jgi:hypothetical protein